MARTSDRPRSRHLLPAVLVLLVSLAAVLVWQISRVGVSDAAEPQPAAPERAAAPRVDLVAPERPIPGPSAIEQRVAALAAPQETAPRPASGAGGRIVGRVTDHDLNRIADVGVVLKAWSGRAGTTRTDEEGEFAFEGLAQEDYYVLVDGETLPEGFLPPFDQETTVHYQSSLDPGNFATLVKVPEEGGTFEVHLTIHRAARVFGHLRNVDGTGVGGAMIRLQSTTPGLEGKHSDDETDSRGYFEMEGVYPSSYQVLPSLGWDHPLQGRPRPIPLRMEVQPASEHEIEVLFASGPCSIEGLVVDQDGKPFPELKVVCFFRQDAKDAPAEGLNYGWSTAGALCVTDERGRYAAEGLMPHRYGVIAGPSDFSFHGEVGEYLLGAWPEVQLIQLTAGSPHAVVPTIVAHRNRPFALRGKLIVDPAWSAESGYGIQDLTLRVVFDQPDRTRPERQGVSMDEDGSFLWRCNTPHCDVFLEVLDRKGRPGSERQRIVADPGEERWLEVRYP